MVRTSETLHRKKQSDAPQAVAASDASGDELARRTFEQVVVVIVRPRRRHRQPVLCRRAGKVPGGAAQARVWQPCGKGGQAGAMRSGTRKTAVRCRMGAWRLPTAPAGPIRGAAAAPTSCCCSPGTRRGVGSRRFFRREKRKKKPRLCVAARGRRAPVTEEAPRWRAWEPLWACHADAPPLAHWPGRPCWWRVCDDRVVSRSS